MRCQHATMRYRFANNRPNASIYSKILKRIAKCAITDAAWTTSAYTENLFAAIESFKLLFFLLENYFLSQKCML